MRILFLSMLGMNGGIPLFRRNRKGGKKYAKRWLLDIGRCLYFSRVYNVARVRARAREILQKDFSRY